MAHGRWDPLRLHLHSGVFDEDLCLLAAFVMGSVYRRRVPDCFLVESHWSQVQAYWFFEPLCVIMPC